MERQKKQLILYVCLVGFLFVGVITYFIISSQKSHLPNNLVEVSVSATEKPIVSVFPAFKNFDAIYPAYITQDQATLLRYALFKSLNTTDAHTNSLTIQSDTVALDAYDPHAKNPTSTVRFTYKYGGKTYAAVLTSYNATSLELLVSIQGSTVPSFDSGVLDINTTSPTL